MTVLKFHNFSTAPFLLARFPELFDYIAVHGNEDQFYESDVFKVNW